MGKYTSLNQLNFDSDGAELEEPGLVILNGDDLDLEDKSKDLELLEDEVVIKAEKISEATWYEYLKFLTIFDFH